MNGFEKWDIAFREQKLDVFNNNIEGLLWLKVRAICRGRQLKEFLAENNITLNSTKVSDQDQYIDVAGYKLFIVNTIEKWSGFYLKT